MTQLPPSPVRINVTEGDCVAVLRARTGPLFDAVVTDPPYELGFMGRGWDRSGVAFNPETWRAIFDQMKPGAHLVAFSGTRTYHRMAVAIEDAGFEIRDQLAWTYGSGFPKSLDVSKAIDREAGAVREVVGYDAAVAQRQTPSLNTNAFGDYAGHPGTITVPATAAAQEWNGWGTALKPAWEPICLARKPFNKPTVASNVLTHGVGGLNIDACRVPHDEVLREGAGAIPCRHDPAVPRVASPRALIDTTPAGRFPANLIHDGSDEVVALFPEQSGGGTPASRRSNKFGEIFGGFEGGAAEHGIGGSSGNASRFFYSAKAGPLDRLGSEHPTVKPVDVMRWLIRLICPPGGLLLDPFAGSGTTGIAALAERMNAELIDLVPEHVADITRKLAHLRGEGGRVMEQHLRRKAARAAPAKGLTLFD